MENSKQEDWNKPQQDFQPENKKIDESAHEKRGIENSKNNTWNDFELILII